MSGIPELFGSKVFNDKTMQEKLPKDTYKKLKETIEQGKRLDISIANEVAHAMKEWALENGCTHYTHWFQPMTSLTAEKHDAFIEPDGDNVVLRLSGKDLLQAEPDASSFPSGGLRATNEARGYTVWDPTSYAFIKDNTLCIPAIFCSYNGEVLDKKAPLLKSIEAISNQTKRLLKLLGKECSGANTSVGAEQEYFIISEEMYKKRPDLIYTGRTLFGSPSPKGQELDDHYFGSIKAQILEYMEDLDKSLWEFGITAKTRHNEVAPAQHELAPVYSSTNTATDQNQVMMEMMKKIARKHGLVCLLHEKPFEGINGSGKHNNWSITTKEGENLLSPGNDPKQNMQFLLVLAAVVKAVDEHQDLLRISVASAGNDHRLGANEAPPAIISIFLGDDLKGVVDAIISDNDYKSEGKTKFSLGATVIPDLTKDTTDRNRTSPFAFTGNKFEFRMVGSKDSVACPNMILNTIVADAFSEFADKLEKDNSEEAIKALIKETFTAHQRIIFNGDGYSDEWVEEAAKRNLLNLKTSAEAIPYYRKENNVKLFEKHKVLSKDELESRTEVLLEEYANVLSIEAKATLEMAKGSILPACIAYVKEVAETLQVKKAVCPLANSDVEEKTVVRISDLNAKLYNSINVLEEGLNEADKVEDAEQRAMAFKEKVFDNMEEVRKYADELETIVDKKYWPYPAYGDILFSVQ
ncbi:glutamine synthetase III [Anaerofustis stercorihominis]|uniref:glutamine synthetase III family protein n=1 Tax=Anaerofustis stercorihominis TaxID=214853 RepID=UPI0011072705|nr:glutamine synthetase III [Anaerofustis stercorihominis]